MVGLSVASAGAEKGKFGALLPAAATMVAKALRAAARVMVAVAAVLYYFLRILSLIYCVAVVVFVFVVPWNYQQQWEYHQQQQYHLLIWIEASYD